MKKFSNVLLTFLISSVIGFAQNIEIDAAKSYFDQKNLVAAKSSLENASKLLGYNRKMVDGNRMALYLYLKGELFYAIASSDDPNTQSLDSNALIKSVKAFAKLKKFENSPSFVIKNKDTGEKEYFDSMEDAEKAAANGNYSKPKKKTLRPEYSDKANIDMITRSEEILKRGNEKYKAKNYAKAGKYFVGAYYLYEALGSKDESLLYNAAISYLLGKDHENAIATLNDLIDRGYTGVKTVYTATNIETGEKTTFPSKEEMKLYLKTGKYKDPKTTITESEELNMYRYLSSSYESLDKLDEAVSVLEKAYKKFPNDLDLINQLGNMYYKKGDNEAFQKIILDGLKAIPNNYVLLYNMGLLKEKDGDIKTAKDYYDKTIEANPKYVQAYINLARIILRKEKEIVDEINSLGFSKQDIAREKVLKAKRKKILETALPILEKAREQVPDNRDVLVFLREIYSNLNMDAKYDELNALIKKIDEQE